MKITLLNNLPILTFRRNLEDLIYKLKITRGVIYPTLFLSFGYWAYYFHEKNHLTIALALLLLAFIRLRKGSITLLSPTLTLIVLTFCLLSPTLQIVFLESSIQTLFPAIAFFLIYALSADTYTKAKDDELIWGLVFSTLIFHLFYHVHEYFLQSMALICALLICAKFHVFWTLSIFFGAALFFGDSISKSVWLTIAFAIFASRIRFSLNPVFKFWYFFSAPLINIGAVYLLDRGSRTTNIFSGRPLIWEFWIENAFLPHWLFGIGPKESLLLRYHFLQFFQYIAASQKRS